MGFARTATDFTGVKHQRLIELLAQANSGNVAASAKRLTDAAEKLKLAATELQTKTGTVPWDGEAATKFREWSTELVTAAFNLEKYTRNAGSQLDNAARQLAQTKAEMPPFPENSAASLAQLDAMGPVEGAKLIDPATGRPEMDVLRDQVDGASEAAVAAMNKLAQAYAASWEQIANEPLPTVVRPVDVTGVGWIAPVSEPDDDAAVLGLTAAAAVGAATAGPSALSSAPSSANPTPYTAPGPPPSPWPPQQASGIPGVVTATGTSTPSGLPSSPNLSSQSPTTGLAQSVGGNPPMGTTNTLGNSLPSSPSSGSVPPVGTGVPSLGTGRGSSSGIVGGQPTTSGKTSPAAGRTSGSTGGAGVGRPLGTGPSSNTPHGSSSGRTGMPMGGVGGAAPVGGATSGRTAGQRPPIGAPGGVVGGTPGRGAPTGRREFSAGGSGLRSGRPMGGMPVGASAAQDEQNRRRQRADYLEEDEETWGGQQRGSVPPVIG